MTHETNSGAAAAPRGTGRCPICQRPPDPTFKPFCTKRCADIDLARWLTGVYRVQVNDPEDEIEEDEGPVPPTPA
ncbi:MAG TPA: DNA gyrase inhibitor YacG [Azospirillaceae bacterium]|nr:DNA gyrase inhibitor YacG [Azospirillaceae bacterium]